MAIDAVIQLTKLRLKGEPYDKGTRAEPNLWTLFFKVDGADVKIRSDLSLSGKPTIKASVGTHASLKGMRVDTNGSLTIPQPLGKFETELVPFALPGLGDVLDPDGDGGPLDELGDVLDGIGGRAPGRRRGRTAVAAPAPRSGVRPRTTLPSLLAPAVGVVYVVLEWDWSKERTVESAHGAFNAAIKEKLEEAIVTVGRKGISLDNPSLSEDEQKALAKQIEKDAIEAATATAKATFDVGSAGDPDDFLGAGGRVFTPLDLAREQTFEDRFTPRDLGEWTIEGRAKLR
jgi:hypothetical protein